MNEEFLLFHNVKKFFKNIVIFDLTFHCISLLEMIIVFIERCEKSPSRTKS